MTRFLVISALGEDRPGIVDALSKVIVETGCNISDSRMTVLGGEFALILMIAGEEAAIARMQDRLPALEEQLGLTMAARPTGPREGGARQLPYAVRVVAMDHPGIVHEVARFFSQRGINIEEMNTGTYSAAHTGAPMFSLDMTVSLPADTAAARLREEFVTFCDELNLDATLEPVTH